jgi:hypothetical protein
MRSLILGVVLVLSCLSGAYSQSRLPNQGLEIVERFGGPARMAAFAPVNSKDPLPLIISNQEDFEKFTALLPQTEVLKTQAPAPSSDPLVKNPRFDWSRYMLLVVFDSQSLSFPPNVSRVEIRGTNLVAVVDYPDTKNLIEAIPPGIGCYGAALVVRSDRALTWNNPGHKAQEAQRQSMMMFLPNNE